MRRRRSALHPGGRVEQPGFEQADRGRWRAAFEPGAIDPRVADVGLERFDQFALIQIGAGKHARQGGAAEALGRQAGGEGGDIGLVPAGGLEDLDAEMARHQLPVDRAAEHLDPAGAHQLRRVGQGLAFNPEIGGADESQPFVPELRRAIGDVIGVVHRDRDVGHVLFHIGPDGPMHGDQDIGMGEVKVAQHAGEPDRGQAGGAGDHHLAPPLLGQQRLRRDVDFLKGVADRGEIGLSHLGQGQRAGQADEERAADIFLE